MKISLFVLIFVLKFKIMIKIYIKNKLRIFKDFRQYLKEIKKRKCCDVIPSGYRIILVHENANTPTCISNGIAYNNFQIIDFGNLGGSNTIIFNDNDILTTLTGLGITAEIHGCVIVMTSGYLGAVDVELICGVVAGG